LSVVETLPLAAETVYVVLVVVITRGPSTAKFHVVNPETAGEIVSDVGTGSPIDHPPVIVTPSIFILFF
jgi:hypothetical protein